MGTRAGCSLHVGRLAAQVLLYSVGVWNELMNVSELSVYIMGAKWFICPVIE